MILPAWTATLVCVLAGVWLASRLIEGGDGPGRWLWAMALGPAVGLGLSGTLSFASLHLGRAPLSARGFLLVVLLVTVCLSLRPTPHRAHHRLPAVGWLRAASWTLLILCGAAAIQSYVVMTKAHPQGSWDAVAIWDTRASFFHRAPESFPALISRLDPTSHPQYPPFLPATVASGYAIAGAEDPGIAAATGAAFAIGVPLLALAVATAWAAPWVGALGASLFLTLPMTMVWSPSHCADVPAAYLLLAAAGGLICLGRAGPRPAPLLVGLCLGLLAWVKDEGVVLAGLAACVWAGLRWLQIRRGDHGRRVWPGLLLGAVPGLVALALFKVGWPAVKPAAFLDAHALDHVQTVVRWKIPGRAMGWRLWVPGESWRLAWWPVWLPAAVALMSARARRPRMPWLLLAVPLAGLLIYFMVYLVSPYDQAWHIEASLDRLLLQLFPCASMGALLLLHEALRDGHAQSTRSMRR